MLTKPRLLSVEENFGWFAPSTLEEGTNKIKGGFASLNDKERIVSWPLVIIDAPGKLNNILAIFFVYFCDLRAP